MCKEIYLYFININSKVTFCTIKHSSFFVWDKLCQFFTVIAAWTVCRSRNRKVNIIFKCQSKICTFLIKCSSRFNLLLFIILLFFTETFFAAAVEYIASKLPSVAAENISCKKSYHKPDSNRKPGIGVENVFQKVNQPVHAKYLSFFCSRLWKLSLVAYPVPFL